MADEKDYLGDSIDCECCRNKKNMAILTKALEDVRNNCNPDEDMHADFYFLADEALKKIGGAHG